MTPHASANSVLAIRSSELSVFVQMSHFRALPAEEIERLYAAVEVHACTVAELAADVDWCPLEVGVAVHHNHRWLAFCDTAQPQSPRSLLLSAPAVSRRGIPLFLDASFVDAGRELIEAHMALPGRTELRLAGLMRREPQPGARAALTLVVVARLRHAEAQAKDARLTELEFWGEGDLQRGAAEFDLATLRLIDHLAAL